MKPVAILRHARTEGPGYFAEYLERCNVPWQLLKIDEGQLVPGTAGQFSGVGLMGGPMSVNDDLPWIATVLQLIRSAVDRDVPVIGHCLGGQLLSKALGGTVSRTPVKEIGWGAVAVQPGADAQRWLGDVEAFDSFHWHGETFTIPSMAKRLLTNGWCENQAFVVGPHIGMQCHVEMTEGLVKTWLTSGGQEIEQSRDSPAVQEPDEIVRDLHPRLEKLHGIADRIYNHWVKALKG
jgi:GMP synthase-like glutamine amidotransferase